MGKNKDILIPSDSVLQTITDHPEFKKLKGLYYRHRIAENDKNQKN